MYMSRFCWLASGTNHNKGWGLSVTNQQCNGKIKTLLQVLCESFVRRGKSLSISGYILFKYDRAYIIHVDCRYII